MFHTKNSILVASDYKINKFTVCSGGSHKLPSITSGGNSELCSNGLNLQVMPTSATIKTEDRMIIIHRLILANLLGPAELLGLLKCTGEGECDSRVFLSPLHLVLLLFCLKKKPSQLFKSQQCQIS